MMRKTIAVMGLALVLGGCATSKSELMSSTENMQSWTVPASPEAVFKTYKRHAEDSYNFTGLLGDRMDVLGYFYGSSAELSVRMVGNPLARVTYLHFELQGKGDATAVKAWHYNGPWKKHADGFRTLLPSD